MVFAKIKGFIAKVASLIVGIGAFFLILPLTLVMSLFVALAGLTTMISLRHHLNKLKNSPETHEQKPPIEGSYTVVK